MLREIPLKTFERLGKDENGKDVSVELTWAALLANILEAPNRMAATIPGMRLSFKILDALDTAVAAKASVLKLEDGLWRHLLAVLEAQEFRAPNRDLVALEDDVKAAPSVDPNAAP